MSALQPSDAARGTRQLIARTRWHNAAIGFQADFVRFVFAQDWAKYNPDQPRVPAGSSDGGQWTSGDGGQHVRVAELLPDLGDPNRVISDVPRGSALLAQNIPASESDPTRPAGPDANFRDDRIFTVVPNRGVQIDLNDPLWVSTTQTAEVAVNTVRRLEPDWQPTPGLYNDTLGAIAQNRSIAAEADARPSYQVAFRFGHNGPPDNESDPASMYESSLGPETSLDTFRSENASPCSLVALRCRELTASSQGLWSMVGSCSASTREHRAICNTTMSSPPTQCEIN